MSRFLAGAIKTQVSHDVRQNVGWRIKNCHTTISQRLCVCRVQNQTPAIGWSIIAQAFSNRVDVVGNTGGAPHVHQTTVRTAGE